MEHNIQTRNTIALRAQRVKSLRILAGLHREELHSKYGISPATLKNWENPTENRTGISKNGAERLISTLKSEGIICSLGWILEGVGNGPVFENTLKKPWNKEELLMSEINCFIGNNPGSIVVLCNDDSLAPFIIPGSYVGGIPCKTWDITHDNKFVIASLKKSERQYYIRQTVVDEEKLHLVSTNHKTKAYPPNLYDVKIKSITEIIWIRHPPGKIT